uniref:PA domain-containing protein n=2 Tax=Chenopodium quinoa TaxID=63459 RepID=A0A803LY59_CHEQI
MKKGIITVASAGNNGPKSGSVQNVAPWLLTVAASTMDREFSAYVKLGNNQKIKGVRFMDSKTNDPNKLYPLISGAEARSTIANIKDATACHVAALDAAKVKGKIVVCRNSLNEAGDMDSLRSMEAKKAGAVGLVLVNDKNKGFGASQPHSIATVTISYNDGVTLFSYINSTRQVYLCFLLINIIGLQYAKGRVLIY